MMVSEGLSPDGWLPDRISVGVLTRVFTRSWWTPQWEDAGAREQRRRLLPARLMVYFVLALWLFRGRKLRYGQVMTKLADGLYHQRRAADLLAGQQLDPGGWVDAGRGGGGGRRISPRCRGAAASSARHRSGSCSSRSRGRWGTRGCPGCSAAGCGLSRSTGRPRTCRTARSTTSTSAARPTQARDGAVSRRCGGWRRRSPGPGACWGHPWARTGTASRRWPANLLEQGLPRRGDAGAGGP